LPYHFSYLALFYFSVPQKAILDSPLSQIRKADERLVRHLGHLTDGFQVGCLTDPESGRSRQPHEKPVSRPDGFFLIREWRGRNAPMIRLTEERQTASRPLTLAESQV
jgi:hypothetical protein